MSGALRPILGLARREFLHFIRQRSRVAGALLTPLLFYVVIGSGLAGAFRPQGVPSDVGYMEYFFPGVILMVLLFSTIFSTISVIEERKAGFMQGVLVAPVSRAVLVAGKVVGGTVVAVVQSSLLLLIAPLVGVPLSIASVPGVVGVLLLMGVGLTSLGFSLAWRLDSTQGFHSVMNLLLLPMWFMSGALFPFQGSAGWVKVVMMVNPLHYGLALMRGALYGPHVERMGRAPGTGVSLVVTVVFAVVMLWTAKVLCEKRTDWVS